MEKEIVNKVTNSPLVTIDLEELYQAGERLVFDMKEHLFQGLILREKDFREFVKNNDWEKYRDAFVAVTCSADAIVPTWAYMLVAQKLTTVAKFSMFGSLSELESALFKDSIAKINPLDYADRPIVIKGCFGKPIPTSAYMEITSVLLPHVKSIMYGEPCSTVPVYKRK